MSLRPTNGPNSEMVTICLCGKSIREETKLYQGVEAVQNYFQLEPKGFGKTENGHCSKIRRFHNYKCSILSLNQFLLQLYDLILLFNVNEFLFIYWHC